MKRVAKRDFPVRMSPRRAGDPAALIAGTERIHEVLGWEPKFNDLDTIVGHSLAWEKRLREYAPPPNSPLFRLCNALSHPHNRRLDVESLAA